MRILNCHVSFLNLFKVMFFAHLGERFFQTPWRSKSKYVSTYNTSGNDSSSLDISPPSKSGFIRLPFLEVSNNTNVSNVGNFEGFPV